MITAAAAELILEGGSAALTHRAVAARAGVALGSTTRYFESIDHLRETALRLLSDEIDASLALVEDELGTATDPVARCIDLTHEYLLDRRQVDAWMALTAAAATDPTLRSLALRWTDRLTGILSRYMDAEQAVALQLYLDGAMVHTVLHDRSPSRERLARAAEAILGMSGSGNEGWSGS